MPIRSEVKRNTRALNQARVKRTASRQLLSMPAHSYTLKIQKLFRLGPFSVSDLVPVVITTTGVATAVRTELGISSATGISETFAVHRGSVYGTTVGPFPEIAVNLYDIENPSTANNVIENMTDVGSASSIPNIHWLYPVNDRPTFNTATAVANFILLSTDVALPAIQTAYVDLLIDYTRVTNIPVALDAVYV
jgi:hypothetical protein